MPAMLLLGTCVMCFAGHLYSMPMQDEAINLCVYFRLGHVRVYLRACVSTGMCAVNSVQGAQHFLILV